MTQYLIKMRKLKLHAQWCIDLNSLESRKNSNGGKPRGKPKHLRPVWRCTVERERGGMETGFGR
ncbi:hypothetical protein AG1IA_10382 [Rhizoctonia solani AG-1 IA]|uniref:Uncharacterized protein n=1 Tax=Thanatephorus cucumeris (strain AG1-IA) TaxID=983506 RepID=L8WFM6_THACA|nr:hypothetical protein AG1IA_10382 [Rhizoctonia solani AG-1 IA]